jgi:hypothetical protein
MDEVLQRSFVCCRHVDLYSIRTLMLGFLGVEERQNETFHFFHLSTYPLRLTLTFKWERCKQIASVSFVVAALLLYAINRKWMFCFRPVVVVVFGYISLASLYCCCWRGTDADSLSYKGRTVAPNDWLDFGGVPSTFDMLVRRTDGRLQRIWMMKWIESIRDGW